ncbi:14969_t:CDS:1, partial [Acaulospora morrowiae]
MTRIHILSDIGEGKKLGDILYNRYPASRAELENQLVYANKDREIAIECGNRLINKCTILYKDNKRIQKDLNQSNKDKEKLSKHVYQLIEEIKQLRS